MRPFLTIMFLSFCLTISAQKYSTVIKDTAITNFMTWLFKSDTSFNAVRHVDNDILKLHSNNFIYADSSTLSNYLFAENIFNEKNGLTQYFTQEDANYFVQQITKQRKDKWNLKIKGIKLFGGKLPHKKYVLKIDKMFNCAPFFLVRRPTQWRQSSIM